MKNQKEFNINGDINIRSMEDGSESRTVFGYAVRFNSESQDMGFIEVIKPGAITEETIQKSDIYARLNHMEDKVLARSRYGKGSLKLELREDGLYYEFEAPNTEVGNELLEHIKRGEITSSSFAFTLPQDGTGERWYQDNTTLKREISSIYRLYDVSPVYEPAYLATSCSKRAADMVEKSEAINTKMDEMLKEIEEYSIL